MPIHKVWSSYSPNAEFSTYVGKTGELFYRPDTGTIHVSDGETPGGLVIASEGTIENSQKLAGELPAYYLDYTNFSNTPQDISTFNNDAGYITSPDGGNAALLQGENASFYLNYANFTGVPEDLSDFNNDLDFIESAEKGAVNGVATLNGTGLVPPSQLPSFVSDVEEFATFEDFPAEGETGKIYVADDTGNIYRWSGSTYIEISDAASTADEAVKLATARTISLSGDATGSVAFDGTSDVDITTSIQDNSHNHTIANVTGLQSALNGKISLGDLSAGGDLTYNSTTGEFSFSERTDSQIRNLFSSGGDLSYNTSTGEFSVVTYKSADFDSDFSAKSTTDLSEGDNLYYTDARVNTRIDSRVDKAFVDALAVDADTLNGEQGSYYLDYNNLTNTPATQVLSDDAATTDITDDVVSVIDLPNSDIGPVQSLGFDTAHAHDGTEPTGTLCWDVLDQTLSLFHPNGVRQQIGQEQYAYVRNNTGTTITNGTVVRFDGADTSDTEARIEVAPLLADGEQPGLYTIGVATQDIANGADGRITVFGKLRGVDTTGSTVGETWNQGDILYVSPTTAGNFTKVKPTAPNNVTPIAAVLSVDSTAGELFVRPTIEQKESYGRFARTTNFTFAATNTAYAIDFTSTEITNGAELVDGSQIQVDQSGFFQIDINLQADASGGGFSDAVLYCWVRQNGVDVDNSTRRQGLLGSAPSSTFSYNIALSLAAGDTIEIMVAADDTGVVLDSAGATAFAPATASALVSVTQLQL